MLGNRFYNQSFRKLIIAFGQVFNNIVIQRTNKTGGVTARIKVPLAYAPKEKFIVRLDQQANLNSREFATSLPRMGFEIKGLKYDASRKLTRVQKYSQVKENEDGKKTNFNYTPVPYDIDMDLYIFTATAEDGLQIVEQILPYFQPDYTVTINAVPALNIKRDIPITLGNINYEDSYDGDFTTRRAVIYTLSFTAKTYVFGPIADVTGDIIKKVSVGYVAGGRGTSASINRDLTYTVLPRATRDYTGDVVGLLAENVNLTETIIDVESGHSIVADKYIYIGTEEMFVEGVSDNKLTVKRSQDNTTPQNHVLGAKVLGINYSDVSTGIGTIGEDSNLIQFGDDFGFDGTVS